MYITWKRWKKRYEDNVKMKITGILSFIRKLTTNKVENYNPIYNEINTRANFKRKTLYNHTYI